MLDVSDRPVPIPELPLDLQEEAEVLCAILGFEAFFFRQASDPALFSVTVPLPLSSAPTSDERNDGPVCMLTITFSARGEAPVLDLQTLGESRLPRAALSQCAGELEEHSNDQWMNGIRPLLPALLVEAESLVSQHTLVLPPLQSVLTPPQHVIRYRFATSAPFTFHRSKFQAFSVPFTGDAAERRRAMEDLFQQFRACSWATHNMAAWRLSTDGGTDNASDEDGEHGAGKVLAFLLEKMRVVNRLVVVSRWFGGVLLGPLRFKIISDVARDHLLELGLGADETK